MTVKRNTGRQYPADQAGKLMDRGDAAFRRGRMSQAYQLYGEAIAHLESLFDATQNAQIGLRLSSAYITGCYPAWRKSLSRRSTDKAQWQTQALDLERRGADLGIHMAKVPVLMTDQEIVGVLCHVSNFAGELIRVAHDFDAAERYIDEAYSLLTAQRPDDNEMPKTLHFGFLQMRSRIALSRGQLDKALSLVDEVIADEQARVARARKRKKKLPPPNWLKMPLELRDQIIAAQRDKANRH